MLRNKYSGKIYHIYGWLTNYGALIHKAKMNIEQLKLRLAKANVMPIVYCINCKNPMEQYCLMQDGARWSVYYSERGVKRNEVIFQNESEACEYLYNKLINDPTTRMK
jgi:hypothetical protein